MIGPFRGSYRFLSNFQRCPIIYDDGFYLSAEHAYQAAKTLDREEKIHIALLKTSEAKEYGKNLVILGRERPDWVQVKVEIMRGIIRVKFRNEELKKLLLKTGDERLVEINDWGDVFWGVCDGKGENWLGKILMEIRAELKQKE
jgi:ribA/ribD-fused uncharacterized protein